MNTKNLLVESIPENKSKVNVTKLLGFIIQWGNLTLEDIAVRLGVDGSTVVRWNQSGIAANHALLPKLHELLDETLTKLQRASFIYTNYVYVCSFAPKYATDHESEALDLMRGLVQNAIALKEPQPTQPGIAVDLRVRSAALQWEIRAH